MRNLNEPLTKTTEQFCKVREATEIIVDNSGVDEKFNKPINKNNLREVLFNICKPKGI